MPYISLLTSLTPMQSHIVLITASSESTSSTVQSSDSSDSDREEEARVAVFDLRIVGHGDPDGVAFKKASDWSFTGPAEGIALCQDVNSTSYFQLILSPFSSC